MQTTNKFSKIKTGLFFGSLGASLALLNFFTFKMLGYNPFIYFHHFDFVFIISTSIGAIWYLRYKINNNNLHFWEGLSVGAITVFVLSLLYAITIFCYLSFIDTVFIQKHIVDLTQLMLVEKKELIDKYDQHQFNDFLKKLAITTPKDIALDEFIKKIIFPAPFIIFLASLVLRKTDINIQKL